MAPYVEAMSVPSQNPTTSSLHSIRFALHLQHCLLYAAVKVMSCDYCARINWVAVVGLHTLPWVACVG